MSSDIVSVQTVDGKQVLADAQGKTLYSADVEKPMIRCTDGCTSFWMPLNASAKQSKTASADLGIKLGVVESALIFSTTHVPEGTWRSRFDRILLVEAPEAEKIARFVDRIAAAFEAGIRAGQAAPRHHLGGWHLTGTLGTIAAAAGAARLAGLNLSRLAHLTSDRGADTTASQRQAAVFGVPARRGIACAAAWRRDRRVRLVPRSLRR